MICDDHIAISYLSDHDEAFEDHKMDCRLKHWINVAMDEESQMVIRSLLVVVSKGTDILFLEVAFDLD